MGDFKNSMFDGKGVMTYPNKDTYDGEWKDGQKHGGDVSYF